MLLSSVDSARLLRYLYAVLIPCISCFSLFSKSRPEDYSSPLGARKYSAYHLFSKYDLDREFCLSGEWSHRYKISKKNVTSIKLVMCGIADANCLSEIRLHKVDVLVPDPHTAVVEALSGLHEIQRSLFPLYQYDETSRSALRAGMYC